MAKLPIVSEGKQPTELYVINTLQAMSKQIQGTPDLACKMLFKIIEMLIDSIEIFPANIEIKAPWTRFLEGKQGLCWNLQAAPTPTVLMGIFSRLQFLPSHYMLTWEECFYTGFFEYQSHLFGPHVSDLGARFVAYQQMEMQNPLEYILESRERQQRQMRWEHGLKQLQLQQKLDEHHFKERY